MKRNFFLVGLIFLVFFAISFLTNILGAINPNVSDSFKLSGTLTGMLPFSFFIAYGLMSIPSGMLVQKYAEKKSLIGAWLLAFAGAVLFAAFPGFPMFLCSLFMIGSGMAMLQVALFPLLRVTGGEEHFAFNNLVQQLFFGAGSFVSPFVYSWLVSNLGPGKVQHSLFAKVMAFLTPVNLSWVSIYTIFALISFVMLVIILATRFPKVVRKEDELVGPWEVHANLFRQKTVQLFFFGIFCYVGVEQGVSNWISEFLRSYHGLRPETQGAATVGLFWGMMTVGCFLGLILLKLFDGKIVLRVFTVAAMVTLVVTLFGPARVALIGFPAMGFCISVMYGIIFALGMNSVPKFHGSFSGILCTAIAGGAILSLLVGKLKDMTGLRAGMLVLLVPLTYILVLSFLARPIISNATIRRKVNQ